MREMVRNAIRQAYESVGERNGAFAPREKRMSLEAATELAAAIGSSCKSKVELNFGGSFETAFRFSITDIRLPSPTDLDADPSKWEKVKFPFWRQVLWVSWLGPFAVTYWNKYSAPGEPALFDHPDQRDELERERCIQTHLQKRGIELLGRDEQEEIADGLQVKLEDNAEPTVLRLLFAQYL